jgi:hypothetical protein
MSSETCPCLPIEAYTLTTQATLISAILNSIFFSLILGIGFFALDVLAEDTTATATAATPSARIRHALPKRVYPILSWSASCYALLLGVSLWAANSGPEL